jgi:hypothetical protein
MSYGNERGDGWMGGPRISSEQKERQAAMTAKTPLNHTFESCSDKTRAIAYGRNRNVCDKSKADHPVILSPADLNQLVGKKIVMAKIPEEVVPFMNGSIHSPIFVLDDGSAFWVGVPDHDEPVVVVLWPSGLNW